MKELTSQSLRFIPAALCLGLALLANNTQAANSYWDINGTTAGAGGATPSGTWESAFWSTDSTGASATATWNEGDFPEFAAGTDATGSYTVTANSDHTIAGMLMNTSSGTVTINGTGILSIAAGYQGFFSSGTLQINSVLGGTGGYEGQTGIVALYGINTFSGGSDLNGNQTYFNNNNSFGSGAIAPITTGGTSGSPKYAALLSTGGSSGSPLTITLPNAFTIGTAYSGINFASSAYTPVVCTGNWDLQQTLYLRNNGNSTAPLTLSGVLSDVGGLTISANNTGTTLLSGANTYSGGTSIIQGSSGHTVQVGNASALGSGATTVASGCVLDLNGTANFNIGSTLTLNGTGISSGGALLNSSTTTAASLSSATPVALGSAIFIGGSANGTYDIAINGVVSGSALLTMVGKNQGTTLSSWTGVHIPTLTLNGNNTSFSGGVTIDYSTVAVGNANAVGTGTLNLNDFPATFQSTPGASPLTFNNALTIGASAPSGVPAQTPACIFGGTGTGNLTFTGAANTGTGTSKTVSADGITVTFSGVISGATTSKFLGWAGGNALTAGPGTIVLAGANTYTKTNILCSGTVQVAYAEVAGTSGPLGKSAAGNAGNIVFNGGTLQYSSANVVSGHSYCFDYSGRFSTVSGQVFNTGGQLYNIDVNGQSVTFATGLNSAGAGTMTLSDTAGGGTLTLSAANTYSGGTTINSGTLEVSGSIAGNVTVNGGVLKLDNTTTLASGATLTLPGSPSASQVDLNLSGGTQNISALYFGTTQMAAGTWGASGAQHNNPAFTGSGLLNVTSGPQPTIAITSITPNPVCAGSTVSLTATVSGGNSPSGTVQFFNGVTSLGTQPLLSGTDTLTGVSLPPGTYANITAQYSGDNYNNPATSAAANPSLVVNPLPTTSAISGNSSACAGAAGVTYSVTLTSGSSYAWTVPSGATITAGSSGPNNNQITVTFGSTGGNVAVTETSATGCAGSQVTKSVTVNALPTTSTITGNSSICAGAAGVTYSVTLTSGSSYAWTVPSGATITAGSSGPNNNQITVTFGSSGGNVAVTETSAAGCAGSQVTEAVTVNNCSPPNITNMVVNLDGSYSLTCTGVLNTPYWLKASSDVTVPLPWTTLPSQNGTILASPFTLTDGPSGLPAQRFYYLTNNAN
jgi:autotransporter-associated beta strand protein